MSSLPAPGSIFDPNYVQQQQVLSLQQMAATQNTQRVQAYNAACAAWINLNMQQRDMGLEPTPVPAIPKKITVDAQGNWSEAPFADLAAPVLPAPVVNGSNGKIAATPDITPQAQLLACLSILNQKLDAIKAKLGI